MSDFWVFGYGSLMWFPGFDFVEARPAVLTGFHRALCIWSVRYRGSPERPGLVFGLQAGGACQGLAFRVARAHAARTAAYLRDRELVTGVYRAEMRPVRLNDGAHETVRALTFTANRAARQYAGSLPEARQVEIVKASRGVSGGNADYVRNTARHLDDMGIRDLSTLRIARRLGSIGCNAPRTYPQHLTPRLPTDKALRCGLQRNLSVGRVEPSRDPTA